MRSGYVDWPYDDSLYHLARPALSNIVSFTYYS